LLGIGVRLLARREQSQARCRGKPEREPEKKTPQDSLSLVFSPNADVKSTALPVIARGETRKDAQAKERKRNIILFDEEDLGFFTSHLLSKGD